MPSSVLTLPSLNSSFPAASSCAAHRHQNQEGKYEENIHGEAPRTGCEHSHSGYYLSWCIQLDRGGISRDLEGDGCKPQPCCCRLWQQTTPPWWWCLLGSRWGGRPSNSTIPTFLSKTNCGNHATHHKSAIVMGEASEIHDVMTTWSSASPLQICWPTMFAHSSPLTCVAEIGWNWSQTPPVFQ